MAELLRPCDFGSARYSPSSVHERKHGDGRVEAATRRHGDAGTRRTETRRPRSTRPHETTRMFGDISCDFVDRSSFCCPDTKGLFKNARLEHLLNTPLLDAPTLVCYKKRLRALRIVDTMWGRLFRSSSMAEHSAVNRRVVGSSPTCGATNC
jgi:hypothetical protein